MNYKRLELYVGWTCNQKCNYCMEYKEMESKWNERVTTYDILKKLIYYKKKGYNHVTYLGGEPFIQPVFYDALKIGKKLGYKILVTTNATTLHIETQAAKFLPYIDELILSVEAIDKYLQMKISRVNTYVRWDGVFENIRKYWYGNMLKANIVIVKDNVNILKDIVDYLLSKELFTDIAITYPDIDYYYYGENHIKKHVAIKYKDAFKDIPIIYKNCRKKNVRLKIPDFPFCIFPEKNRELYIKLTDDYDYQPRLKLVDKLRVDLSVININNIKGTNYKINNKGSIDIYSEYDTSKLPYRERINGNKCNKCIYLGLCKGYSVHYEKLFGLIDINPILS